MDLISSLPDELIIDIVKKLPAEDIVKLGKINKFNWVYNDWDLWASKSEDDFNYPRNYFYLNGVRPIERYAYIKWVISVIPQYITTKNFIEFLVTKNNQQYPFIYDNDILFLYNELTGQYSPTDRYVKDNLTDRLAECMRYVKKFDIDNMIKLIGIKSDHKNTLDDCRKIRNIFLLRDLVSNVQPFYNTS